MGFMEREPETIKNRAPKGVKDQLFTIRKGQAKNMIALGVHGTFQKGIRKIAHRNGT